MTHKKDNNSTMSACHDGHRARMKEKLLQNGKSLEDHELLEILLYYAVPRKDTNVLAHTLISKFGSLKGVLDAASDELAEVDGLSRNGAALTALFREMSGRYVSTERKANFRYDTVDKIGKFLLEKYVGVTKETVFLLLFNNSLELIECAKMFEGSVNSAGMSPRTMFDMAYSKHASSVVLAHNHPGGIAVPSGDDINITENLAAGFELLGIDMLEHIIVADDRYMPIMRTSRKMIGSSIAGGAFYNNYYGFEQKS